MGLIRKQYRVIALLDNDAAKWSDTVEGILVCNPDIILKAEYDKIVIATSCGLNPIIEQLIGMGVSLERIDINYPLAAEKPRILFLEKLGELFREQKIPGCVAEAGIFQGEFAKEINRVFPERKFFLFDTFTGFDRRDIAYDQKHLFSQRGMEYYSAASETLVLRKMPHPDTCVIRKGYFPETAAGLNETFCFVNLDFDLYQPTLAGLEYFFPRMATGGVILVHDYFSDEYKGVSEAVVEFAGKTALQLFPIGDLFSVGILC